MNRPFYCYSPKLKEELESIGENPITRMFNQNTNKLCWVYLRTENLLNYLTLRKNGLVK